MTMTTAMAMPPNVVQASSDEALRAAVNSRHPTASVAVCVTAAWQDASAAETHGDGAETEPTALMSRLFDDLAGDYPQLTFVRADCADVPAFVEEHAISCVPCFLLFEAGVVRNRIEGAHSARLADSLYYLAGNARPPTPELLRPHQDANSAAAPKEIPFADRLAAIFPELAGAGAMILLVRGTPESCDDQITRAALDAFAARPNIQCTLIDITQPERVAAFEEISKTVSCSETPQLWYKSRIVAAGLQLLSLLRDGAVEALASHSSLSTGPGLENSSSHVDDEGTFKINQKQQETLEERLTALVKKEPVMVFMKGSPASPRCGFSRKLTELFKGINLRYGFFDILKDEDVRQGLKSMFDWPTYPQIYVDGELIGGLDIVTEMVQAGQFQELAAKATTNA